LELLINIKHYKTLARQQGFDIAVSGWQYGIGSSVGMNTPPAGAQIVRKFGRSHKNSDDRTQIAGNCTGI
jgi:hypothetical protein